MGKKVLNILIGIIVCLGLGLASGFSTITEIGSWYAGLQKPSFNPPNWLFGPIWTILYIAMGISVGLIWSSSHPEKKKAVTIFCIQFILNLIWSFLFFNLHLIGFALIDILCLLIMIVLNIKAFYPIHKLAAYLLIPYLMWVSFATILNLAIWQLN